MSNDSRAMRALAVVLVASCVGAAASGATTELEPPAEAQSVLSEWGKARLLFSAWYHTQQGFTSRYLPAGDAHSGGNFQELSFYIKAVASDTLYAVGKLDVEDEDDVLEQMYFAWKPSADSWYAMRFGEMQVRFGQQQDLGYNSGLAYGWPMVSGLRFPGWMTDTVQFESQFKFPRQTSLYVSSMLNPKAAWASTSSGDARDTGFFQSYAVQLHTQPVTGLEAKLSYVNFHDEEPNTPALPTDATDSATWSVAVRYTRGPVCVFFEHVGTRDWNNVAGFDLELYEAGAKFELTPRLGIGFMCDTAVAAGQGAAGADAELTNFMFSVYCNLEKGIKGYVDYIHQEEKSADELVDAVQFGILWWF